MMEGYEEMIDLVYYIASILEQNETIISSISGLVTIISGIYCFSCFLQRKKNEKVSSEDNSKTTYGYQKQIIFASIVCCIAVLIFTFSKMELYSWEGINSQTETGISDQEGNDVEQGSGTFVSKRMWEDNDAIYTVYDVRREGYTCISGDYVDTMILYNGRIYWRKTTEEGKKQCQIISMNLDSSDQKILTELAHPSSVLCIYNNYLYYTSLDGQGNKGSRRINLKNKKDEEAPPYMFQMGNDEVWISISLTDGKRYCSDPGFENPVFLDGVEGSSLGVFNSKYYYMQQVVDGTYTTYCYDGSTGEKTIILENQSAKSIVNGTGLYYKSLSEGSTILHRIDLENGTETDYELGDFHLYMGGGLYELDDNIFITRYLPENKLNNTEFWAFSRKTGEKTLIGQWYNSNAENAAKEL